MNTEAHGSAGKKISEQSFRRLCREVWTDCLTILEEPLVADEETLLLRAVLIGLRKELGMKCEDSPCVWNAEHKGKDLRRQINDIMRAEVETPFNHEKTIEHLLRCSHEIVEALRSPRRAQAVTAQMTGTLPYTRMHTRGR